MGDSFLIGFFFKLSALTNKGRHELKKSVNFRGLHMPGFFPQVIVPKMAIFYSNFTVIMFLVTFVIIIRKITIIIIIASIIIIIIKTLFLMSEKRGPGCPKVNVLFRLMSSLSLSDGTPRRQLAQSCVFVGLPVREIKNKQQPSLQTVASLSPAQPQNGN